MLRYEYENATVYITKPTEKHIENIRKATEVFMRKIIKEEMLNESGRNNRRTGVTYSNARRRDKQSQKQDKQN